MMKVQMCVLFMFVAVLLTGLPAQGEPFMGNWEGSVMLDSTTEASVAARVIGTANNTYRVQLDFTHGGQTYTGELAGLKRDDVAAFAGHIDVGAQWGGVYTVTLEATKGYPMSGRARGALDDDVQFELRKVYHTRPNLGAEPPEGAVVLFDGDDMDEWELLPGNVVDGIMRVGSSHFVSKREFGDHTIHLEFMTPYMPYHEPGSQGRGNSGLYVQGRYEIQILDSFGDPPADNLCGGVYQIAAPITNASLSPNQWQTYEVEFRAPRFDEAGEKTENARMTVYHNGVLIHDDLELPHPTGGALGDDTPRGPVFLQDHGDPLRFRNIWVVPLDE